MDNTVDEQQGLFANEQLNVPILKWNDKNMNFAHHFNANINLIIKIFILGEKLSEPYNRMNDSAI